MNPFVHRWSVLFARMPKKSNPKKTNQGAQGLMQLMPETQAEMGVRDPFDPRQNILGGTKYLDKLLKKYNGDLQASLAAYNGGPGNVDRSLREIGNAIPAWLPETQEYVPSVLNHLAYYEKLVDGVIPF